MTAMQKSRTALLVAWLLWLTCITSGLSEPEGDQSGTFSVDDYNDWLENHSINVVNYVAKVGTNVVILSPITPPPIGMRWFSLNFDDELRRPVGKEVGGNGSTISENNTSWESVFKFDKQNRYLSIRRVQLGNADLLRVFVGGNGTGETVERSSTQGQFFDVAITLMTFEKHECGFTSKPQNPKAGDMLILSCSVIVNGMWNASLIFRNDYDESEIIGETKTCGIQRSLGSKICSSVRVKAETDILAYSCRLKFSSNERHIPKSPMFLNSKWTTEFNKEVVCNLPKIYLEAIPSDVTLMCNNMPCGETVVVDDVVTCIAHGYPQPVFDLRIRDVSAETENNSESPGVGYEDRFFMDTDEEEERDDGFGGDYTTGATAVEIKGREDFRIGPTNVGHIEITCNVSNALGWGYSSLVLEVKLSSSESETNRSGMSTFRLEDYNSWKKHQINLVNYVAEVGSNVLIWSPIIPAPIGIHWFSLNMDGQLLRPPGKNVGLTNSSHLEKFKKTYRTSWEIVFDYDRRGRWLNIQKIPLGYSDVFRVFVDSSSGGNADNKTAFDVVITLMTFEKHECGYVSKPSNPTEGDEFVLNCSVIVNGWWNASLVFRNAYDGSEIKGELSECNDQPSTSTTKICSTVRIKAETDILAYSCRLEFPPIERHDLERRLFKHSKWTDAFNTEVVCYLPEIYLEVIPSDVTFLCNNMPCGDTALVNDTVTCVAHGYPQPLFDLQIRNLSVGDDSKSNDPDFETNNDKRFFMDTSDGASEVQIRGSANYRMSEANMGRVEITCNVSNALGWGFNSMIQEIKLGSSKPPGNESGTFRLEDYSYWLKNHTINLVNYVAEAGKDVLIMSPITPAPIGIEWFSRNMDDKLSHRIEEEVSLATSNYLKRFQEKYATSWHRVFQYDEFDRWLKILNVSLDYADVFRVSVSEDMTGDAVSQAFDVLVTLAVVEKHECGFTSKPQNPKAGDTLILSCSVIVNGLWDVSLVFVNGYDQSKIIGETKTCGRQPSVGSKICSTVNVEADADILAYSCRLEFFPSKRQEPKYLPRQSSKWSTDFNSNPECYLPKVYLEAIPSDVSFLCNQMPCGDTASVNDTVTCMAYGYPQPVFDLRIQKLSGGPTSTPESQGVEFDPLFMDTADESSEVDIKGFEDYRIRQKDVGQVELTCNVSNELGWGSSSLVLEIIGEKQECGFTSRPQNPKKGDSLNMSCSVIVNGLRNASLIFRNDYDESEITGIMSECDSQPSIGTKICSTVEVTAVANILAYSCRLKFPPSEGHDDKASQFHSSTWTTEFNDEIICTLPKIYLDAIPSDVSFLCNQMPCGDTASVNDTVTCLGHGYPQPDFDLRIQKLSGGPTSTPESQGVEFDPLFMDTADESSEVEIKGFEDYRIRQKDVGQVKLTCNVSNELGWGSSSLVLKVTGEDEEIAVETDGEVGKRYSTEKHECGFTSRPQNPKKGDSLILSCSVIVNGLRNASLIFRNDYDENEITGIMSECDSQPSIGTKICSTVKVTADADILAYSCRLKFPPSDGHDDKTTLFHSSTWTAEFNEEIICTLPKIYLEVIPSNVSFLCNQMPCGDTALVDDTVTCLGHGYPQPVFDLRIKKLSPGPTPKGVYENRFFLDTTGETGEVEIRGFKDYRIRQKDVGKVEITCNVSNVLGWEYGSLALEINGDVLGASESYTTEDYGISKDYLTTSEAPSVLIQCNGFRCEENQTLVVGDEISCIAGGGMSFDRFVLVVNKQTIEGDDKEVKYVLQMADIGDINVECLAYLTSGVPLMRTVPVIVRESKPEQGEAAGDIDLEEAATIVKKPSGKPDSGSAEKEKEVPKVNDEMAAEKSAGDDKPKPSIGSGRESFVLLQLFLAFIAAFVGLGQF